MKMPDHMFHGYAAGFGARFEAPVWRQVVEASTALPPVGGSASAVSRDFRLEDLFAFREARSSVVGHFYQGETADKVTAETRVSASVSGLVIPGVLSVDRVSMALVSEKDFVNGQEVPNSRRFRLEEARIDNLLVYDPTKPDVEPFNFDALREAPKEVEELCKGTTAAHLTEVLRGAEGLYRSHSSTKGYLTPKAAAAEREPTRKVKKGDTTYQIHLVELFIRHGQVDLNMFRVEISSNPTERSGSGSGGSGGVNGTPST